ncbi:hypothetical protein ACFL27_14340 [candidate division CSSED10-310 bacterium]|uniref:Glycosyltransferase family 8 protein n=1 Tax=candidate division CSSED10-310 bacterium TaxID=2855610 RepID=A0ABV6YYV2_UNCC1
MRKTMRLKLGLVSETTKAFLNQVKLCLYSFRKNAGTIKNTPIILITNNEPLSNDEKKFFKKYFSPIEFKTMPRLGAILHTSKLNVFYAIDPTSYDVLLFLDCDTVIARPLDNMLDPIKKDGAQFVCRRGGKTDRNTFVDFNGLVKEYCGKDCTNKILFEEEKEWPMFNTGVFLATSGAVKKIRLNSIQFTYEIYNKWQTKENIENLPLIRYLFKFKILKSKQIVLQSWPIEQGAVALSCIKAGLKVHYLDEIYNSWGQLKDLRILHCFKSAYKFDRSKMFSKESGGWIKEYKESGLPGKIFLANLVEEYKKEFSEKGTQ